MPHEQIPDMLGRVLSGTKYGVGQTRGKFGLGAKMALIWSKMTTGMSFEIRSAQKGKEFVSRYQLDIDIHRNSPNVQVVEVLLSSVCNGICCISSQWLETAELALWVGLVPTRGNCPVIARCRLSHANHTSTST
jgi:hypothetical protein